MSKIDDMDLSPVSVDIMDGYWQIMPNKSWDFLIFWQRRI